MFITNERMRVYARVFITYNIYVCVRFVLRKFFLAFARGHARRLIDGTDCSGGHGLPTWL
jgi:hypothetical protein